jgi:hypothetical protein
MAGKTVAIIQSNYIPWKGYFDVMHQCDEFILFDEVQYTRNDWRNRNKIKTADGIRWLTIPVKVKGRYYQRINEVEVQDTTWVAEHKKTLFHAYRRAAYFDTLYPQISAMYDRVAQETHLSQINHAMLLAIRDMLGIPTPITWSSDYVTEGIKSEKLLNLCQAVGATTYISGPSAKSYMDDDLFERNGVKVVYKDYSGYPEYPQLYPPFEHGVSVLDVLFNTGDEARKYCLKESR